jgi:flagellar protein FlgJ
MIILGVIMILLMIVLARGFFMTEGVHSIAQTKEEFVKFIKPYDEWASQHWGYERGTIAGQIALETGWGKKVIDKNLFNMKRGNTWTGKVLLVTTTEYIDGLPVIVKHYFRVYKTYNHSMNNYIDLISGWSYYAYAWNNRHNSTVYYIHLQGKFATDPNYSSKCNDARNMYISMIDK